MKAYEKTELYALEKLKTLTLYSNTIDQMIENQKLKNILTILMQVEMFSEFGLSVYELSKIAKESQNTVRNRIRKLDEKTLIKEIKIGKRIYYSANLNNIK